MRDTKRPSVAVIMPAYNEASVIGDVVRGVNKVFNASSYKFEIIVVNDRSMDDTSAAARKAHVTVIDHLLNQGAGGATSTGLRYAEKNSFDLAVTMDSDGQHDPKDVLSCVNEAIKTNADLLIGSRLIDTKGMSRVKIIGNRGLSFITWALFGVNVTDSQSGLRVFSSKALDVLEWKSTSYDFCSEMLWRAKQAKLDIREFPIKAIYTAYSKSKGQNNWNGINIVKSLVRRRIVELFE
jgi:glycosyltransferase involved in cell wall biosynthesis